MPLSAGTRVGPYEILGFLAAGAMGEVYRAHDARLRRDVALKILPPAFVADADRLARFKREAQVLASLNHSRIAAIYGIEEAPAGQALVMELVEGPTLADRIARGAIPLDEALPIARQIVEALEAAHERGIVHRDLKPANIKLRPDGAVKVLDFGLAKAIEGGGATATAGVGEASSQLPTVVAPATMTSVGMILGTAAYMSPEQARGRPVDKRTDIWAFGCVLYEMLTGRRAFAGKETAEVLLRVLERDPDFDALPGSTPPAIRTLLRRCLEKDRDRRLPDVAVARLDIDDARAPAPAPSTPESARRAWSVAAAVAALGIVLGGIAGVWWSGRGHQVDSSRPAVPLRTMLDLPAAAPLALGARVPQLGFDIPAIALSPDGRRLAYIAGPVAEAQTRTAIQLLELDTGNGRPIPGTDGATFTFFSPDGRSLGFLTDEHVKKVALDGSAPVTLAAAVAPVKANWTDGGHIYFVDDQGWRVSRVSAAGGSPEIVVESDSTYWFGQVLPGERAVLATTRGRSISADYSDVVAVSFGSGEVSTLVESGYDARFVAPGFLLFGRAGGLFAVPFDAGAGRVTGEAIPLARDVSMESMFAQMHVAASDHGTLAYVPGGERALGRLTFVDRDGGMEDVGAAIDLYGLVDLAKDGRIAVHVADVIDHVWIWDPARREGRKLAATSAAGWPLWRPDGSAIAFTSWTESSLDSSILLQPLDGRPAAVLLPPGSGFAMPISWTPDGRTVATRKGKLTTAPAPRQDPSEPTARESPAIGDPSIQVFDAPSRQVSFSPDGHWIAYAAFDTGRSEVFIVSYPAADVTRQFSVDGGIEPLWCANGELFYRKGNQWMSSVMRTTPELAWDPPRQAFQTDFIDSSGRSYSVSPDGRRLLVVKRAEPDVRGRIHVITDWTSLLSSDPRGR